MTPDTLPKLTNALRQLHLLSFEQLETCARELEPRFPDPQGLARELARLGLLTSYQVNELFLGRGEHLLLGSYVLLERIGEGGMGTVYKARNWKLVKIVALKVIKKDRLLKPDTIKRFYREIRAVAQLDHPNIVRAYDADEVNETHFFVMEYVEGSDLSHLVKSRGPLPFTMACEYMRQAALGLQHAFERGMVHRDIKPHNLLLAACGSASESARPQAAIKILDMGLALIETPTTDDDHSSTMTHSGVVMGTPDYMAPEQSLNAHAVDIRADLYSLGCTFYFLLTGRPPFTGGTFAQKLMRHQLETPEPIRKARPDVPPELETLVARLLAKRPEDRPQTPRELASALEAFQTSCSTSSVATARTVVVDASSKTEVVVRQNWAEIAPAPAPGERPQAPTSRLVLPLTASLLVLFALGVGIWWATRPEPESKPEPVPVVEPKPRLISKDPNKVPVEQKPQIPSGPATDEWVAAVRALPPHAQPAAVFDKLSELNEGFLANHETNVSDGTSLRTTQPLTDLSPVRALAHLSELTIKKPDIHAPAIVSVVDLSPLKGLPLKKLDLTGQRVEDLSPLRDMPLTDLILSATRVSDLSVIPTLKFLAILDLSHTPVADLGPLASFRAIDRLNLTNTLVKDLRPLANVRMNHLHLEHSDVSDLTPIPRTLTSLTLTGCRVEDLSPLAECAKLESLEMVAVPFRSLEPLAGLKQLSRLFMSFDPAQTSLLKRMPLKSFNNVPAVQFWKLVEPDEEQKQYVQRVASLPPEEQVKAAVKRMRELNPEAKTDPTFKHPNGTIIEVELRGHFPDLRFLAPFTKLEKLSGEYSLGCLEPLRGLPLRFVGVAGYGVVDLSPLVGMPLETLSLAANGVKDYEPLRHMPTLRSVTGYGQFHRLNPLAGLRLPRLGCAANPRDLSSLKDMKSLESIVIHYDEFRHRDTQKEMAWLKQINHKPVAEFWNGAAEEQVKFVRGELKRHNPGFEKVVAKIEKGAVTHLEVHGKDLQRLDPIRTLSDLQTLLVKSNGDLHTTVSLEPLRGLPLQTLHIFRLTPISFVPLEGMKLDTLWVVPSGIKDLSSLRNVSVRKLHVGGEHQQLHLKELSPLKGKPLEVLHIHDTAVTDLSPLAGMPLKELWVLGFWSTVVEDLSPLRDMPLASLNISSLRVTDLTPLRTLKALKTLHLGMPRVKDLHPLEKLPLEHLGFDGTNPESLAPLKTLPLKTISNLNFEPFRGDADVLRAIPTLTHFNNVAAKEFLKKKDEERAAFEKWCEEVAKLPAKEQAERVAAKLKELNLDMTARTTPTFKGNSVEGLHLSDTVGLRDISPVRALQALRRLEVGDYFGDTAKGKGDWTNLYPLRGMRLEGLRVCGNGISDLEPLKGMNSLINLILRGNRVVDLSPLRGLSLKHLDLYGNPVSDLSPLQGMKLGLLILTGCKNVVDLSALRGMPLRDLSINVTGVTDITPLKEMPLSNLVMHVSRVTDVSVLRTLPSLTHLSCDFNPERDTAILKEIKTLKTLNGKPVSQLIK